MVETTLTGVEQGAAPAAPMSCHTDLECLGCGHKNTPQDFCGKCGKPLSLQAFIAVSIRDNLKDVVRDKNLLEMDAFHRVLERLFSWMKMAVAIAGVVLIPLGVFGVYKFNDLTSTIDAAKTSIAKLSDSSQADMKVVAERFRHGVQEATDSARAEITRASSTAISSAKEVATSVGKERDKIQASSSEVQQSIVTVQEQLKSAEDIRSEVVRLRADLSAAVKELEQQQKIIQNQESFVKNVFSAHRTEFFDNTSSPARYRPVAKSPKGAVVFILLSEPPIPETIQIQYHIFAQPRNSYVVIDNLVMFFWDDPIATLKAKSLSVSYFPDKSNKRKFGVVSEKDGNVSVDSTTFVLQDGKVMRKQ